MQNFIKLSPAVHELL